ncbi:MAG: hypothetical protein V4604_06945 [Bacteroidota bacterium]
MLNARLFLASLLALCFSPLSAQETDSIVSIHSVDYEADTVESSYTNVITYRKGKEISNIMVEYWGTDIWRDSTTTLTTYDADGKPLLRTTRSVSYFMCEEKIVNDSPWTFPALVENSDPEKVSNPYNQCYIYFHDTTVFYGAMETRRGIYEHEDTKMYSYDTVLYYPDHLIKAEINYPDGKFHQSKHYRYVCNEQGKPVKTFIRVNNRNELTSIETHQIYEGSKPHETYQKTIFGNDSTHFSSFERKYDKHFNQIAYTWFQNGAFFGSGTSPYSEDGYMLENNTYNADSSLCDHHEYRWKFSPNTTEHWSSQNYRHSTDLNGFSYGHYDTIRTPETIEVRISGKRIEHPKHRFKSYKAKDCQLSQVIIYDNRKRYREIKNFDETGKVSSVMMYNYSL